MNNQKEQTRPMRKGEVDVKTQSSRLSPHEPETVPARNKRNSFKADKLMLNRCCHIDTAEGDFDQLTEVDDHFSDEVKRYHLDTIIPDTINQDYQSELCSTTATLDSSSHYAQQTSTQSYVETFDGSQWQNVDNTFELEQFLNAEKEDVFTSNQYPGNNIRISEVPRVKVIAEKFSKYKQNNVEVRRLEEKILCLEYDVFTSDLHYAEPSQTMKAYFSVKPIMMNDTENVAISTSIKNNIDLADIDLDKLNEKEIEVIEAKKEENKPYLDDLEEVLKRKQAIYANNEETTLDLMSLYEMAKRDTPIFNEDFSNTIYSNTNKVLEEI